jgi:hypothetical protein
MPDEYVAQMQSEKRTVGQGGKPLWEVISDRPNHFWDCEVMGLVPALGWKLTGRGEIGENPEAPTTTTTEDEKTNG